MTVSCVWLQEGKVYDRPLRPTGSVDNVLTGQGMLSGCTIGGYEEGRQVGRGITSCGSQRTWQDNEIALNYQEVELLALSPSDFLQINVTLKDPDILPPALIMAQR
eukprot:582992-Hanusia_phi.AAC.4